MERNRQSLIRVFYDGRCGLCHSFVVFVLKKLHPNRPILFSPIGGKSYQKYIKMNVIESIIVYDEKAKIIFQQSDAVIHIFKTLGGIWRIVAFFIFLIPRFLRDRAYQLIAKNRYKFNKKPATLCPTIPKKLRKYIEND